jgi:type II secretory pathway pseudopilin PulG
MVTVAIIGILASAMLFALFGAQETAREQKTKALIMKLNNIIMPKYEAYRTRRVPMIPPPLTTNSSGTNTVIAQGVQLAAKYRLDALHDIMRMEMPDRWSDITDAPIALANPGTNGITIPRSAINSAYCNAIGWNTNTMSYSGAVPTTANQGAECLYLIVTLGVTDNLGGRELFNESNIGDVDGDGFKEFIDGWGQPIRFLRWAPGFPSELNRQASGAVVSASGTSLTATGVANAAGSYAGSALIVTTGTYAGQTSSIISSSVSGVQTTFTLGSSLTPNPGDLISVLDPDPFDPRHVYSSSMPTFALYPLIYSAGPNRTTGIVTDTSSPLHYTAINNNPFATSNPSFGTQQDLSGEQTSVSGWESNGWLDNIHNHLIGTR